VNSAPDTAAVEDSLGRIALVLSGGGARAAYFGAGVAAGLADAGLRPTLLSGTSAGGLNVGLLAGGLTPSDLTDLWTGLHSRDVYRPRLDVWRLPRPAGLARLFTGDLLAGTLDSVGWTWLLDSEPARRTLVSALGGPRVRVAPGVTVVVSAVAESTGGVVRFTNAAPRGAPEFRPVDLTVDHLLASASAPVLFPPVTIDGEAYADAGMVANTPLAPALDYRPDTVIVVTSSTGRSGGPAQSLGDAIALVFDNVARFSVLRDYRHTASTRRSPRLVLVEPSEEFEVSGFLRFDPDVARTVITHGRQRAHHALTAITRGRP